MRQSLRIACLITAILPAFFEINAFAFAPSDPCTACYSALPPNGFELINQPVQSDIQPGNFRLSWETSLPTTAAVFYGTAPNSLTQSLVVPALQSAHTVTLTGLAPGTVYWVQVVSARPADTIYSPTRPYATQSLSSGAVKVFFTQGIDYAAAGGLTPAGDSYEAAYKETLERINAARQTLDVVMYNTNRSDLVNAVKAAHNRGVRVRYIAAAATANTALKPPPAFPVLYGNDSALMHNKFLVIDADLADDAWVMSGSMNWTNTNMVDDYNNVLFIQDQSLARAYELEFNEMWGGNTSLPDPVAARFGSNKTDNTPHDFVIGGKQVSCYFSPSDQVTRRIEEAVRTADHQASFALFSFTKNELGNAMIAEHNSGTWVRGLIENINDQGTEYEWLRSKGIPVQAHPDAALLHHKYAVMDAGYPDSEPIVVTGSHNWSQNAESNNDENTLIIRDRELAVLFQAEFERRWAEISTSTVSVSGQSFELFPNPVHDRLFVRQKGAMPKTCTVEIHNASGVLVHTGNTTDALTEIKWPDALPAGTYIVSLKTAGGVASVSIQAIRR